MDIFYKPAERRSSKGHRRHRNNRGHDRYGENEVKVIHQVIDYHDHDKHNSRDFHYNDHGYSLYI